MLTCAHFFACRLTFLSLFVPILFFAALCCCLPLGLSLANALGMAGRPAEDAEELAWIDALPTQTFVVTSDGCEEEQSVHSPASSDKADATADDSPKEGTPNERKSESSAEDGPARGGLIGTRQVDAEDAVCVVCIGQYTRGAAITVLPCSHHFHSHCIGAWLRVNPSCPLCKARQGPSITEGDGETRAEAREAYLRAAVRGGDDLLSVLV